MWAQQDLVPAVSGFWLIEARRGGSERAGNKLAAIVFLPLLSTPSVILPSFLLTLQSYPYCSEMKTRFTPTLSTAPNGVKEDNFTLANISLLFLELCEYTLICHYIAPTFQ